MVYFLRYRCCQNLKEWLTFKATLIHVHVILSFNVLRVLDVIAEEFCTPTRFFSGWFLVKNFPIHLFRKLLQMNIKYRYTMDSSVESVTYENSVTYINLKLHRHYGGTECSFDGNSAILWFICYNNY